MNSSTTKKRRVDEGGHPSSSSVADEDRFLMQTLNQLLDSNRTQMAMMSSMQGEITRLTVKCDRMERSIDTMQRTQNANYNSTNQIKRTIKSMQMAQNTISQNTNSRFDDVDNKQKYHEVLIKNQQWKYAAPRPSHEYWNTVGVDEDDVLCFLFVIS